MVQKIWRNLSRKMFVMAVLGIASAGVETTVFAQAPSALDLQALQRRLDQLEQQNLQLQDTVRTLQTQQQQQPTLTFQSAPGAPVQDVRTVVADVLKEQSKAKTDSEAAAKKKAEDEGHVVGSSLGLTAKWNHGLWFESAQKDFKVHVGGRTQYDVVGVQAPDNVQFGTGGFGPFNDGSNFRRARLAVEGTFWEIFNFNCEYDFVNSTQAVGGVTTTTTKNGAGAVTNVTTATTNNTFNTPVPTDLWFEITQLPFIGNFRVGNQKPSIGFEHMTSSRFLNFMERSMQFDSFIEDGNNGFAPGFQAYNWTEDQRATAALGMFKTSRNIFGTNVGDGEWGTTGRVTWLPYWEENGRCFVHLGMGATYRALDDDQLRYRSRTELRNGSASLHTITAISQVQAADGQMLVNPEFVVQMGPFLLQAEYNGSQVDGVTNVIRTPLSTTNTAISKRNYYTQGAYVEVLYFLTGEHRDYNKKMPGLGRVIPIRNAFWVPGEGGSGNIFSKGAWQVGARYSWLDLTDNGINGGEVDSFTLGLNWFWNPNFKIQWNYEYAHRDVGVTTTNAFGNGSGDYQGVGMRFAFDF